MIGFRVRGFRVDASVEASARRVFNHDTDGKSPGPASDLLLSSTSRRFDRELLAMRTRVQTLPAFGRSYSGPTDRMADVRRWSRLLDSQFTLPGPNFKFGLD